MDQDLASRPAQFADRLSRAQGRKARRYSATAKMTREEHNELEAAAKSDGRALGEWAREVLLREARRLSVDPTFTEIVAIRQLLNSTLRSVACGAVMTPEAFQAELQGIRSSKHKAAAEVMQQYAATEAGQ
ncbi:hypothetical protein [Granulicella sibirica]|uniref:hypothetical protein n=1 Tax=Granulicella sibirica TaxID=2479048 RepID=UPI001008D633|nr:hypothetical protein [Granulicella sibirica]